MKKIFIYKNDTYQSRDTEKKLKKCLAYFDLEITSEINLCDFIFVIGGDGALLQLMHKYQFPTTPIVGINTGHLGFFQEISPEGIDKFLAALINEEYRVQPYNIAKAVIVTENDKYELRALNEFVLKSTSPHSIHFNIGINQSFIEKFSGDGVLVSTPAGSTGYNYSLGGALVDPRLNLLQVTPMAPMNTTAFRTLTSPILIPQKDVINISPCDMMDKKIKLFYDGIEDIYEDVKSISLTLSKRKIQIVRFEDYTFWYKVKEKFL